VDRRLRALGVGAAAAALAGGAQACLGLWPQTVLADLPNCAEYPSACASYEQAHSGGTPWIVIAGVILLAAVLIVAAGLWLVVVRRRRHERPATPPASAPSPPTDLPPSN
jgi:hypothetical protein